MRYLLFLVIGLVVGGIFVWARSHGTSLFGALRGIVRKKTRRKEAVMKLFETRDQVTNNDVERALGVSDSTAARYLGALEEEGLVVRKGVGRGIFYTKTRVKSSI